MEAPNDRIRLTSVRVERFKKIRNKRIEWNDEQLNFSVIYTANIFERKDLIEAFEFLFGSKMQGIKASVIATVERQTNGNRNAITDFKRTQLVPGDRTISSFFVHRHGFDNNFVEVQWDEYVKQFKELNFNIVARPFMITNSLTSHLSTIQLDLRSFLETGFQPGSLNQHCTYEHKDRLEAAERKLIEQNSVVRLYRKQRRGYNSAKTGKNIINRMKSDMADARYFEMMSYHKRLDEIDVERAQFADGNHLTNESVEAIDKDGTLRAQRQTQVAEMFSNVQNTILNKAIMDMANKMEVFVEDVDQFVQTFANEIHQTEAGIRLITQWQSADVVFDLFGQQYASYEHENSDLIMATMVLQLKNDEHKIERILDAEDLIESNINLAVGKSIRKCIDVETVTKDALNDVVHTKNTNTERWDNIKLSIRNSFDFKQFHDEQEVHIQVNEHPDPDHRINLSPEELDANKAIHCFFTSDKSFNLTREMISKFKFDGCYEIQCKTTKNADFSDKPTPTHFKFRKIPIGSGDEIALVNVGGIISEFDSVQLLYASDVNKEISLKNTKIGKFEGHYQEFLERNVNIEESNRELEVELDNCNRMIAGENEVISRNVAMLTKTKFACFENHMENTSPIESVQCYLQFDKQRALQQTQVKLSNQNIWFNKICEVSNEIKWLNDRPIVRNFLDLIKDFLVRAPFKVDNFRHESVLNGVNHAFLNAEKDAFALKLERSEVWNKFIAENPLKNHELTIESIHNRISDKNYEHFSAEDSFDTMKMKLEHFVCFRESEKILERLANVMCCDVAGLRDCVILKNELTEKVRQLKLPWDTRTDRFKENCDALIGALIEKRPEIFAFLKVRPTIFYDENAPLDTPITMQLMDKMIDDIKLPTVEHHLAAFVLLFLMNKTINSPVVIVDNFDYLLHKYDINKLTEYCQMQAQRRQVIYFASQRNDNFPESAHVVWRKDPLPQTTQDIAFIPPDIMEADDDMMEVDDD